MSQTTFDVVIVGGGINGLAAAAYLSKAGLSTVLIERRDQVGAHCATEEHGPPGFRMNPHATSILTVHGPCMQDLELERFGLKLAAPRYTRGMPFADGKAFVPDVWNANELYKKWARFSTRDADVFKHLMNGISEIRPQLMQDFFFSAPTVERWDKMLDMISRLPEIPSDWWDMTGFELADYLYEDDHLKAQILSFVNAIAIDPFERAIGPLGVILLSTSTTNAQALGGSHQLPHALFRCVIHYGGKILQSCEVEKIIVEDGEAKGVILSKHSAYPEKKIMARRCVISNLSPVPTFLQLVGEDNLDREAVHFLKLYDYNNHTLFTASYMTTSPPNWKGAGFDSDIQKCWNFNVGVETMDDVKRHLMDVLAGGMSDPLPALGSDFVLTLNDPSMAPSGFHNVLLWANVPYRIGKLRGDPEKWDEIAPNVLDSLTSMMDEYSPGFSGTIKHKFWVSPRDIERRNPSAIHGTQVGGRVKAGQMYLDRPFYGCGAPRTPIRKLYLSNGTWPWGHTWLACGYIAAAEVIKDLNIAKPDWWSHTSFDWYKEWAARNKMEITTTVTR